MTKNWDFYSLLVNDEPASIYVDLGIEADVPMAALPHMAYIRLYMNQPRADGLSSQEEFDTLIRIEDVIEADLCGAAVGYVGRNTSGGCRDFFFYTSEAQAWPDKVAQVLSAFENYRYETGTREDAEWSTYLDFLLPGQLDRHRMQNRRVCDALAQHGDKLTAERDIDHWSYFQSLDAATAYLAQVEALGFRVRDRSVHEDGALRHGVQIWRADVPSYRNIDGITVPLFEASERHGGEYDGWECAVEVESSPASPIRHGSS
jgi:hypothetical protein